MIEAAFALAAEAVASGHIPGATLGVVAADGRRWVTHAGMAALVPEPEPLTDVMGSNDPFPGRDVGRPVTLSGDWLEGGFWVADREHEGREGYWAVSPLSVPGADGAAVLVVRGWSAQPDEQLLAAEGPAEVVGWLQPPEGSTAVDDDPGDDVFPEIRVADAIQRVDTDLFSA